MEAVLGAPAPVITPADEEAGWRHPTPEDDAKWLAQFAPVAVAQRQKKQTRELQNQIRNSRAVTALADAARRGRPACVRGQRPARSSRTARPAARRTRSTSRAPSSGDSSGSEPPPPPALRLVAGGAPDRDHQLVLLEIGVAA